MLKSLTKNIRSGWVKFLIETTVLCALCLTVVTCEPAATMESCEYAERAPVKKKNKKKKKKQPDTDMAIFQMNQLAKNSE